MVLGAALALTGLGLVLVYSTASPLGFDGDGPHGATFLRRSAAFAALGAVGALSACRVRPERLRQLAYPALAAAVVLLVLVWVPSLGREVNGAHRWIRFGALGLQPSEFAKLALVLFLAHTLAKRGEKVRTFGYGFLPVAVLTGVPVGLVVLEPDLGTAAVMGAVVLAVAFAGGVRLRHLAVGVAPALAMGAYLLLAVDFRLARLKAFADPWEHAQGAAFQLVQSLLAFGVGGVWGVGLGAGRQKLHYLPEAHTDFILSVWAEERGLVGVLLVLATVALLVGRGYAIALRQRDPFRRLLATGITTWLGLQAGLNALVVTGCVPTKGLPFPFLSYGGSGLVTCLVGAGVLAGLAREPER
ncbi:MAG: putative lipid II flippase FtsW [Deferrisomatales bacterium]